MGYRSSVNARGAFIILTHDSKPAIIPIRRTGEQFYGSELLLVLAVTFCVYYSIRPVKLRQKCNHLRGNRTTLDFDLHSHLIRKILYTHLSCIKAI